MQNEDDLRGLAKVTDFMRAISFLFLAIHIYWFCYGWLHEMGWTLGIVDRILSNFQRTTGLFSSLLYTKLFCVLFLGLSCMGNKGVKKHEITWRQIIIAAIVGTMLFFLNWWLLSINASSGVCAVLYITTLTGGFFCLLASGLWISRLLKNNLLEDVFNRENESFMQETKLIENEYSVNLPTKFWYKGKEWKGWINVVNPFRASMILGTPGSGKSYAVVNNYIKQAIEKSYALYIYDFKFDDLSVIAYNHLIKYRHRYKIPPKFYVINFDNPRKSHRCNPLAPELMTDISDAYESSYTIMLNLNKSWVQKQGDFFVESPIVLFTTIIWFLKLYENGKYCTFPHAIELLNKRYEDVFTILTSYPDLENYLSPFVDAWKGGAAEQLMGQIASAKIPLSRLISPQLYWVMSGSDFTLDINNPKEPKILCVGNNPDRISIYGAALGLYNLIATARSNKVAVVLGFQDFSQLKRDYGDKEAAVIMSTVGNVFSGQVVGETAKTLSERFGKILQKRESMSINRNDTSTSISTQLDSLIPASKISTLSQGMFVGAVTDSFGETIDQKIFHAQIVVDNDAVQKETAAYQPIPEISSFLDENDNDTMEQQIQANYRQIKQDIVELVENELIRIENDPELKHLLDGDKK